MSDTVGQAILEKIESLRADFVQLKNYVNGTPDQVGLVTRVDRIEQSNSWERWVVLATFISVVADIVVRLL